MSYFIRKAKAGDQWGIAGTITEAFFDSFRLLSQSRYRLIQAIAPAIQLERFVVAEDKATGLIVGTVGLSDEQSYSLVLKSPTFRKQFGWLRGTLGALIMANEINRPRHFFPGQGQFDFVAVRMSARGHGLAQRMLEEWIRLTEYRHYTLDVVEGNERALTLYERIGFHVVGRENERGGAWLRDFAFRYLMQFDPKERE